MEKRLLALGIAVFLIAGTAMADDDCDDSIADWKTRDALRKQLEDDGWVVKRIKVDDGCYEVNGFDPDGNRFEAKYSPASLELREMEIKRDGKGSTSGHMGKRALRGSSETTPAEPSKPE